jgi:hypothetical protein
MGHGSTGFQRAEPHRGAHGGGGVRDHLLERLRGVHDVAVQVANNGLKPFFSLFRFKG